MALRKESSGVVLDCQLPHLIGLDDLLSTGVILYYLKVNTKYELNIIHTLLYIFLKSLPAKVHNF